MANVIIFGVRFKPEKKQAWHLAICQALRYITRGAFAVCSRGSKLRPQERPLVYTPQHIANYFLDRAEGEGRSLSPLKLIKLVYIAYGWVLALTNERLFDETIEAWQHGPVIPSVYHEFKHYRSDPICERAGTLDMETGSYQIPRVPKADTTTLLILEKVWAAYRGFSGWALRNKTHEKDTPWTAVYDGTMDKAIPDALIAPHFHKKIREIVDAARAA